MVAAPRARPEGLRRIAHASRALAIAAGTAAALFASGALAAPQLEEVKVAPNPLVLAKAIRPEVIITVTVKRRPFDFSCDASITPGDGHPGPLVSWGFGDSPSKTTRYEYRKPGKYRLAVRGIGNSPCRGRSEAIVIVR